MATGWLAYHVAARHGYAIERLKRDMAGETDRDSLLDFLAYDAASFVWVFLLANGNAVSAGDRQLRDDVQAAIISVLARHGIDRHSFVIQPDRSAT